jgi:hypothetical protein
MAINVSRMAKPLACDGCGSPSVAYTMARRQPEGGADAAVRSMRYCPGCGKKVGADLLATIAAWERDNPDAAAEGAAPARQSA